MRLGLPLLIFLLLLPSLLAIGCKKVENTTPRYNKSACLICNRMFHEKEAGKCLYCKGSGTCSFCQGKGTRLEGKKGASYETICSFCNGTGKCHYCESSGKCSTCKGTGHYVPIDQPDSNATLKDQNTKGNN
ncbi:MAG: hypothetical protein A2293_16735 [Elusimicrobia bacterium RIFOXYB2_FULL_49_7]|nr:MAG: hypothetical protein A2293_16735 [Elusimicrobia bacterium RIFOXYB2_FULL_49_7]